MLSNVSALGVLILFRSLATIIRRHVSLQGPLLVEMSGFSLTAAPMKAQAAEKKTWINKNNNHDGAQMQTETLRMIPF